MNVMTLFLQNLEHVIKCKVDLAEDIARYNKVLNKASSKVNFNVCEYVYMMPSDMNLQINSNIANYDSKILVSRKDIVVGVNHRTNIQTMAVAKKPQISPSPASSSCLHCFCTDRADIHTNSVTISTNN